MNYIVVDLEWNQALSSNSSVFNKLPIHLRGEIIEIGAVKLTTDMTPGEEFSVDIRPVFFKQLHYKVKKITGFDKDRMSKGVSFVEAFDRFRDWCGEDITFLTWGSDDQGIMEQNIIIHDLDWDWIHEWINLQLIYNLQTGGGKEQKSLKTAMEFFEIPQTRTAHDALGDAYNTALVCSKLDMAEGLKQYPDAPKILSDRSITQANSSEAGNIELDPSILFQASFAGFFSKAVAFSKKEICETQCPVCNGEMVGKKWLNQGDQRYINIFTCQNDGSFFVRLKFKKHPDENIWDVKKLVYKAEKSHQDIYINKSKQLRRRGRKQSVHNYRKF